ncbi:endoribonuclease Dicer homolog 2a [Phragmites australis]|uniref:endoribonuclease Dicer homolog 2a n=1 Tax=Phragmites australis TaxID=29695 RepID=UPI002D768DC0|nr:endoribonuclease Dicer homolog 2a [Phragmites australis]
MANFSSSAAAAAEEEDPPPPTPPPPPCDAQTLARWYQLEALERAVAGNTVAFLETGAGKTLIAVLLLRAYAHRISRPASRSFAVFLVPTVVLVGQQARVVEAHTDLRVAQFYGEMGVDFWSADTWLAALHDAEVLVMTPQILLDNLRHSFFRLQDIALLIFDECHRAKGNSPYACILKEFYHPQLNSRPSDPLPRIFGMTASLIYSKGLDRVNYSKQISELENLMNAKVYTVDSESALSQYIPFATTRIVQYDDSTISSELHCRITSCLNRLLTKHLGSLVGKLHGSSLGNAKQRISKLHQAFSYCIDNLGVWLAAKAAEVQSYKESCISFWGEKLDEQVEGFVRDYSEEVYRELSHFSKRGQIGEDLAADLHDGLLTSKVHFLINSLLEYRHVQDLRCIVFVERVITSIVLESLLSTIHQMSGWTVKYMAGNSSRLQSQSRKKHMEIVDSFRSGKVHLIIATQILEEGLDVPSCNLVIRFDPSATVCSFIQSRGRARMQNSDYILLVRRGDAEALSKTKKYLASGQIMREESLRLAHTSCQPLENTLCEEEYYCVESTGAVVTLNSSVPLIYFFCSKLPSDEYFKPLPRFNIDKALGICTLHLPKSSPVQTIRAEGEGSVLKQVVCLKACRELHANGALTDSLLPTLGVPCEDEPDIVVERYKHEQPDYFPEHLLDNWFSFSRLGLYHCYKISLERCFGTTTFPADVILAVKCDMGSDFISNSFKLWGVQGDVNVTMKYMGIIHLTKEQVTIARRFQTIILSLLINDEHSEVSDPIKYLHEVSIGVVYLLLPLVSGKVDWCSMKFSASPIYEVTDKDMRHCHSCKDVDLLQTKDGPLCRCMLQNSVVCTPHNSMFYAVTGFLDLNANSLLHRNDGSVVSYKIHFKTRHDLNLTYEDQPLLAASKLLKVRNFLHRCHYKKEKECSGKDVVELPPELCRVVMSPVSANTLCTFSFVPSIMYRIQCILLSVKLKNQLGPRMHQFDVPSLKILEALTTKKCQEDFSQESLETLGDSFLKYVITQHLFRKYNLHHEGMLTKMKKNLISNAALCQLACNNNLVGYIRSAAFNPETWIIPGLDYDTCGNSKIFCVSPNMYSLRNMSIKSKRIADSVEALIGAYLSAAGENAAFLFLLSLGMDIEFHSEMTVERKITTKSEDFINVRSLETMLGYNFSDPSLLMEALTHGSYQIAGTTACYQRLEFLGDAVLDHIFTDYFYHQYPECTPGLLTDLRSASVNNNCYAHAAVKAGLHKHILHSSSELHRRMAYYLENFKQSFSGPSHGWEAGIGLPKVLGDVIESIAGAIYIDSKYNKKVVWRSMKRLLEPLATPKTVEHDPVKELQELCDRMSYSRSYTETHENGVSSVVAKVQAEGTTYSATRTGPSKLVAKKLAAKAVLQDLKAAVR